MEYILNNEYLKVTNPDGSLAVNGFFEKVRCETNQKVEHSGRLSDITAKDLPEIPKEGKIIEADKMYQKENKVYYCKKEAVVTKGIINDNAVIIKDAEDIYDIDIKPK